MKRKKEIKMGKKERRTKEKDRKFGAETLGRAVGNTLCGKASVRKRGASAKNCEALLNA